MKYFRFVGAAGGWSAFQSVLRTVRDIAVRRGVSMANIASRYILDQPAVAGVIIGARLGLPNHVDDNVALFALELDERDRAELDEALSRLDPIPGDSGDEYRKPPFLTASGDLSHHLDTMPPPYRADGGPAGQLRVSTGTEWESIAGYSRAVRAGSTIAVSGTTATHRGRLIGGDDPTAQFHAAADKVEGALQSLGARLEDVVRTRVFVRAIADWKAVAVAHGERFGAILPANTLVEAELVGSDYLVELEADAVVTTVVEALPPPS